MKRVFTVASGILFLSLLSQVSISLSWTPVPITGQTFAVLLISLLVGRTAALIVFIYLVLGFLGLPIFAKGGSGFHFGPTSGYLFGMLLSAWVVGTFVDRGWATSFWRRFAVGYLGSLCVFAVGLSVLSFYVPAERVFQSGYFPFVPGDLLKITLASGVATIFKAKARTKQAAPT